MSSPAVSVIVPNFNHAKFLRQRLDSILNQTFHDFEIILLDDCSADDSLSILNEYKLHSKVSHYIANPVNSGSPFSQWRRGFELAAGKYIWIAESDDFASPKLLERLVTRLEEDSRIVLAYCRSQIINESGDQIGGDFFWADPLDNTRWRADFSNDGESEIRNFLAFRNTIPNASAVVFLNVKSFGSQIPVGCKFAGDWLFWGRILRQGRICFISEPLNYFRNHSATTREATFGNREVTKFREYLVAVDEFASRFVGRPKRLARDHSWILQDWCSRTKRLPFWVFSMRSVSWRVRSAFFLSVMEFACVTRLSVMRDEKCFRKIFRKVMSKINCSWLSI